MISSPTGARLALALAAAWMTIVVWRFILLLNQLPVVGRRQLFETAAGPLLVFVGAFVVLSFAAAHRRAPSIGTLHGALLLGAIGVLLTRAGDTSWLLGLCAFLTWSVLAVSSVQLGLSRWCRPGDDPPSWGISAAVLVASLFPISFLLGLAGWMQPLIVGGLALAAAAPALLRFARFGSWWSRDFKPWLDSLGGLGTAALCAITISLFLSLIWTVAPEVESDPVRTHIPYMQQLVQSGGLQADQVDFFRRMVYGTRAVFATAMALGSLQLSRWLSWFACLALVVLLVQEVTRRSRSADTGLAAGAALASIPLVLFLGRTLYHDHVIVLLVTAAFALLCIDDVGSRHEGRASLLAACIIGCVVQAKYNALIFGLIWCLFLLIGALRSRGVGRGLRWCVVRLAVVVLVGCPWYLHTWATTGNPIYPYLNALFQSPLWPQGLTTEFNHARFTFGSTLLDHLTFPWQATFHSSRIDPGHNGRLGFFCLALMPLAAALHRTHHRQEVRLLLASAACFFGIYLHTAYARYWLPAVPLLLIALFVAARRLFVASRWTPNVAVTIPLSAIGLGLFLLPLPIFWLTWAGMPWQVYRGNMSHEQWLTTHYLGTPAVFELNEVLEPQDRVLVSGLLPVHRVAADAIEWPLWIAQTVNSIGDADDFDRFVDRHGIDYWMVNHSGEDGRSFGSHLEAPERYWGPERLVVANGPVAAYDLRGPARAFHAVAEPLSIEPALRDREATETATGWSDDSDVDKPATAAFVDGDGLRVPPGGSITLPFTLPQQSTHLQIGLDSVAGATSPGALLLRIQWLDDAQGHIAWHRGNASTSSPARPVRHFPQIPPAARAARLTILPWGPTNEIRIGEVTVDFLRAGPAATPSDGAHQEPPSEP